MANGPFKMAGWSPFTKSSPAKNEGENNKPDPNAYEKMLQADKDAGKALTPAQEKILGKYNSRKFQNDTKSAPTRIYNKPKGKRTEY